MKLLPSLLFTAILCAPVWAADAGPKDTVTAAAAKLAAQANYSWKTTVVVPEGSQFRPGPTEGQTEKDGYTHVTASMRDTSTEVVFKGGKSAVLMEGEWKLGADIDASQGTGRFLSRLLQNFKDPAAQATDLAKATKELKADGDVIAGALTEEGAKSQFRAGNAKDVSGSVRFWIKEGALTKYEVKAKGKMDRNGTEVDVDRTTTVEIKSVGTTKVEVPEGAKKKLS